jgi:hypothetical protein
MPDIDPAILDRLDRLERDTAIANQPGINPATGCPLPPIIIDPDSMAGQKWAADKAKYDARRAEEKVQEDRLRLEREAEEERKRQEWEANRPKREAAERELVVVEAELEALDKQLQPLRRRAKALEAIAKR